MRPRRRRYRRGIRAPYPGNRARRGPLARGRSVQCRTVVVPMDQRRLRTLAAAACWWARRQLRLRWQSCAAATCSAGSVQWHDLPSGKPCILATRRVERKHDHTPYSIRSCGSGPVVSGHVRPPRARRGAREGGDAPWTAAARGPTGDCDAAPNQVLARRGARWIGLNCAGRAWGRSRVGVARHKS
jgi:hypothetical protein